MTSSDKCPQRDLGECDCDQYLADLKAFSESAARLAPTLMRRLGQAQAEAFRCVGFRQQRKEREEKAKAKAPRTDGS